MLTHTHVTIPTRLNGSKHALKTHPVCVVWSSCQLDINSGVQHWIFMFNYCKAGDISKFAFHVVKRTKRTHNMYPERPGCVRGLKSGNLRVLCAPFYFISEGILGDTH